MVLEPIHRRHAPDLFRSAHGAAESWTYLPFGPFDSVAAWTAYLDTAAADPNRVSWAVRPAATGVVSGFLSLVAIEPKHGSIELGGIWFAPAMQRTRAATEAMFLPLKLAADELGYRRLVWKCNALNAPSKRAAERLGFVFEGTHRMHMTVKGRRRDTDWYSIVEDEWPACRDAFLGWLAPENFAPDGTTRRGLAEIRAARA
jgi:RimJ/RimL family protein N-acetyltransferase